MDLSQLLTFVAYAVVTAGAALLQERANNLPIPPPTPPPEDAQAASAFITGALPLLRRWGITIHGLSRDDNPGDELPDVDSPVKPMSSANTDDSSGDDTPANAPHRWEPW
eukprot:gene11289-18925_t